MLKVVEYGKDEYTFPALLVLGCFDAIHLGHRELIKKAKLQAKINGLDLGVMVFRDGKGGDLIYSFEERLQILEGLGVKFVMAIDFNDDFKSIAPLDFLNTIESLINVKAYMSGKDFRFGAKAKGKASTLKSYAEDDENGVWYMSVKDVLCDGEKVSTTLIKSCLDEGNVKKADKLLCSDFNVTGEVVHGAGRGGEEVGFPTVNITYPAHKYPLKEGVYKVYSIIDGTRYDGIANYGNCPTFNDERIALEVYFEGFSGDLYGRTLTVYFVDYIRDIVRFDSVSKLADQLRHDVASACGEVTEEAQPAQSEEEPAQVSPAAEEVSEEVAPAENAETSDEHPADEQPAEETESGETKEEAAEESTDQVVDELLEEQDIVETASEDDTQSEDSQVSEQAEPEEEIEGGEQPAEETESGETKEEVAAESTDKAVDELLEEQDIVETASDDDTQSQKDEASEQTEPEEEIEGGEQLVEETEVCDEQPVEGQPAEETETCDEKSVEESVEQPAENAVADEQPAEQSVEQPAEQAEGGQSDQDDCTQSQDGEAPEEECAECGGEENEKENGEEN